MIGSDPSAERRFVEELTQTFASTDPRVHVGIGDDGAVVRTSMVTVAVCDPVVEGVHFTREDPPQLIGRKAVNRNLSDLAAMGAKPSFLLVSLLLPGWLQEAGRRRLTAGIQAAAQAVGASVVGGDVARTAGPLVVTVTALGEAPRRPLRRGGLAPGQTLHVTGPVGGSILGRHLRFTPRVGEGRWLAEQPCVRAAIDVSDGLLLDLWRMITASAEGGVGGAVLHAPAVPLTTAARRLAAGSRRTAIEHGLEDGEDHELLFGVEGDLPDGGPLTGRARRSIGVVTAEPGLFLEDRQGRRRPLRVRGFEHDV